MTPLLALALVAASVLAAAGQVLLKLGSSGRLDLVSLVNPKVAAGLALYAAGVVLWLIALARLPLSVVYPFTIVTLGLVFAASVVLLGERPGALTIAGWCSVALGLAFIAVDASGAT